MSEKGISEFVIRATSLLLGTAGPLEKFSNSRKMVRGLVDSVHELQAIILSDEVLPPSPPFQGRLL